ncbi:VOC family protein [Kribbella kalugense]|uniref:Glyoxalase-like domain-containing protein n=1 Tax=Kribbella kalugense TaxID=2512221 RepID=A0A4R7ZDI8_9ACTN|nr:VOC family protein [Kribbella kalugense]TDW15653.1 hypothetical protein EV650_7142 [Kribbella kalugense]
MTTEWRLLDDTLTTWYDAPSHSAGAALVERLEAAGTDVDLRPNGLRLRTPSEESAREISAAAKDLGLTADPTALQTIRFGIAAADPVAVRSFWETVLGYEPSGEDPSRRDPQLTVRRLDEPRPLRNRIHVDVVRPSDVVDRARVTTGRDPSGPWGVMLADDEGNEVDLVPGDPLPETTGWQTVFSAMTFYPTTSALEARRLASAVAKLADDAGTPLQIDLRPAGVTIDGSKDQWEDDAPNSGAAFVELAKRIESAAHDLGLAPDAEPLRFVQFGIDAVDVEAVRAFWVALLGYQPDPRAQVSDIYDPRRLNPVLFFQQLDANDERTKQRNRIHFELVVPDDQVQARIETALSAGGRVLDQTPQRCLISDPEGNEIDLR